MKNSVIIRLLALLCLAAMVFLLASCSSLKEEQNNTTKKKTSSSGEEPVEPGGNFGDENVKAYEKPVEIYEQIRNGDVAKLELMAPPEMWALYEKMTGETLEEYLQEREMDYQEYKEEYGENSEKVELQVVKAEQCDDETIEQIEDAIYNEYDKRLSVSDAYYVDFSIETSGDSGYRETAEALTVEIGDAWYLLRYWEEEEGLEVYFLVP